MARAPAKKLAAEKKVATVGWTAQGLRFSAFMTPGLEPKSNLLESFTKNIDVTEKIERPALQQIQEAGTFGGASLSILSSPGRVDIIWIQKNPTINDKLYPEIGAFDSTILDFVPLVQGWITNAGALLRVAIGAILWKEFDTSEASYRFLRSIFPRIEMSETTVSDFFFQINRRRPCTSIEGLTLNSVRKWSHVEGPVISLAASGVATQSSSPPTVRLELDFSTAAENVTSFTPQKANEILLELTTLAQEVAERGDI